MTLSGTNGPNDASGTPPPVMLTDGSQTVWIKAYVPPTSPPPTEEMDSMPRWEYEWWQGWIERHAVPPPRRPFRLP